jgi:hypothetical protein
MSNPVTFKQLLSILNETFANLPDVRKGRNKHYSMGNAAMAAFSFMQSASCLAHQQVPH